MRKKTQIPVLMIKNIYVRSYLPVQPLCPTSRSEVCLWWGDLYVLWKNKTGRPLGWSMSFLPFLRFVLFFWRVDRRGRGRGWGWGGFQKATADLKYITGSPMWSEATTCDWLMWQTKIGGKWGRTGVSDFLQHEQSQYSRRRALSWTSQWLPINEVSYWLECDRNQLQGWIHRELHFLSGQWSNS